MNYQQLGKSDLTISRIGFGCMSLGFRFEENEPIIKRALELGITYFDTADLYDYGGNERMLGRLLKGQREKVIIASKVGNQWRADGSSWVWNPRKEYILKAVEYSLDRLQTDYLDLYQLHGGTIDDPIDEVIEAFELLKEQGKIRYYGISSIRPNVIREYAERSNMVSVMMQYSLLDRRPEESCLDLLHKKGIAVLARGVIAQGLLVNKPAKDYLDHTEQDVKAAAEAISCLSEPGRSKAQTALLYVLAHPAVCSAVTGIRNLVQLEDVANAVNSLGLSAEELVFLQVSVRSNFYDQHR
jgi:aryl-alcohol dehydrogenase-like predicted oxidoreductase